MSGKYVNALTPISVSFHDGSSANASWLSSFSSSRNTLRGGMVKLFEKASWRASIRSGYFNAA